MFPPKITDSQIRGVIHELARQGSLPSGRALRAVLEKRFGCPGGVARIYRLLAAEGAEAMLSTPAAIAGRLQQLENRNLREQLRQMHAHAAAHQAHWAREIAQLHERVQSLEPLVQQAASAGTVTETVLEEVKGADLRAGRLKVMLRAFGPAPEGKPPRE
jgi:hypothetical protein